MNGRPIQIGDKFELLHVGIWMLCTAHDFLFILATSINLCVYFLTHFYYRNKLNGEQCLCKSVEKHMRMMCTDYLYINVRLNISSDRMRTIYIDTSSAEVYDGAWL